MSLATSMAQNVLTQHWDRTLPINIADIAKDLGVKVIYSYDLPSNVSGSYHQTSSGDIIKINASQHSNRQRFTLAHELGHHVLLHGDMVDDDTLFRQDGVSNPLEVDANKFAAELLMPKALVEHLIRNTDKPTVDFLADKFGVSTKAMIIRLKNLGWL